MVFVTPVRLELTTLSLKVRCSNQLSYEVKLNSRLGFLASLHLRHYREIILRPGTQLPTWLVELISILSLIYY